MVNSYISRFINSKDIRTYLDETGHEFPVTEYAFLIWQCRNLPLHERHDEFRKLVDTTESVIVKTSTCRDGWDLHRTILEYISLEERMMDSLKNNSDKCFYTAEWSEGNDWHGGNCYFEDYEKAYLYAKENGVKNGSRSFHIYKHYIDNRTSFSCRIDSCYDASGDMISIDISGDIPGLMNDHESEIWTERFDYLWFDIPIPFKPGDIVCDCYRRIPFVITETVPWFRKEHPPKSSCTLALSNIDMCASGYTVDPDTLSITYNWLMFPYLNLEYYDDPLSESEKILYAYSLFKQNEINGDTLTKISQVITYEHLAGKCCRDIDWVINTDSEKILDLEKYKDRKRHL